MSVLLSASGPETWNMPVYHVGHGHPQQTSGIFHHVDNLPEAAILCLNVHPKETTCKGQSPVMHCCFGWIVTNILGKAYFRARCVIFHFPQPSWRGMQEWSNRKDPLTTCQIRSLYWRWIQKSWNNSAGQEAALEKKNWWRVGLESFFRPSIFLVPFRA